MYPEISEYMEMASTAWLGIDIAKQKFDVALHWNTRRRAKVFRNDAEGWHALLGWLKDLGVDQVHACLEATGRYGDGLALHLHDAGHRVSVVNPAQIKHFGRAKLGRNKTDRADAALICDYCRLFEPAAWTPPSVALGQLRDLVRTREALTASRVEWTNRRAGQRTAAADAAMAGVIARLEAEIATLDQAIKHAIGQDEEMQAKHDLLISVPGIGTHTAALILSELPGPDVLRTAREAAAYAGLSPSHRQSGSALDAPSRVSRIGNATLRAALYFPALTAIRWNPLVAALGQRLKEQGRLKPKQIVVAAMRKLLHLCFGVLKTGKPFDPDHVTSTDQRAATT
jgi:transposase